MRRLTLAALLACIAGSLLANASASAEFSRPYITQITGTPTGPLGEMVPFPELGGLAIDPDSPGHIWVGESEHAVVYPLVDEFSSSNEFIGQLSGLNTNSLAYDDETHTLENGRLEEWLAVDNSGELLTDLSAGDVYQAGLTRAQKGGTTISFGFVARRNGNGVPAPFTCLEHGSRPAYINEEGRLIGRSGPGGAWEYNGSSPLRGVAVDSGSGSVGDVYVLNVSNHDEPEVDQFTSEGCFMRAFTEAGAPGKRVPLGPSFGLAVDPTTGDLVVETEEKEKEGQNLVPVIDEFASGGEYLGQITGISPSAPFGKGALTEGGIGIAVSSAGDLYVDVCETHNEKGECDKRVVDELGPGAFFPGAVTGAVTAAEPKAVTLNGVVRGVSNAGGELLPISECQFEYVAEEDFVKAGAEGGFHSAAMSPCVLDESGSSPVGQKLAEKNYAVHGEASPLQSGEVYDYRLVAAAGGEHGGSHVGEAASFAAPAAPQVEAVSVGDVSSSFVDFSAGINPLGSDTTYQFQYVSAVGYEAAVAEHAVDPYAAGASVPVPAGDVGSGDRSVSVSVPAGGLSPGTVYHYRVVASNGVAVTDSPDGVFATVPAGSRRLPDGRSYELLTPPNKGDAEDLFGEANAFYNPGGTPPTGEEDALPESNVDFGFSSEDGGHFLLRTRAAFGPFAASGEDGYVFSRSEESGWSFKSAVSPSLGIQTLNDLVFDPADLSMVGFSDLVGAGSPDEHSFFALDGPPGSPLCEGSTSGGCYATVTSGAASPSEEASEVGASTDLSHVLVQSESRKLPLCEGSQQALAKTLDAGVHGLYEWTAGRQCLSLVDVRSEGGELVSKCGAVLGPGQSESFPGDMRGAVSADGSKIFFTAPDPGFEGHGLLQGSGCWNGGAGNPPELYMRLDGETTVEVSEPEHGVHPPAVYPAIYVGASTDGSKVFFMTRTELTKEAVKLGTSEPELYEYDTQAPEGARLIRVSRGDLGSGPVAGRVLDVPAISADGSAVYFNAEGDLTPEAHAGGLYRYDTETGSTTYVASVQAYPPYTSKLINGGEIPREGWYHSEVKGEEIASMDIEAPYYATGNGRFLLFGPYRYDAADGSTVCVMCNPDGSGPIPHASFVRSAFGGDDPAGRPPRPISENGEYVFFDTTEALVPRDTNGVLDVYEWHDGVISLVSSGQDPKNSYFLDSSSCIGSKGETVEGCNVFFGTHAQLVPADTDSSGDLYDARIGGGFEKSAKPVQCEGDACDNPPPAPVDQTPFSLTGSLTPDVTTEVPSTLPPPKKTVKKTVKCHRGFVRRKVKKKEQCVKKRSKETNNAKKTSNRKGRA
jgi:hypothetical protein